MSYSNGHAVRAVAGRLALDFANTADWAEDGSVVHEKLTDVADLSVWLEVLGLEGVAGPYEIDTLLEYRCRLRDLFLVACSDAPFDLPDALETIGMAERIERHGARSVEAMVAASAVAILADRRERERIRQCPGDDCGWLFLDETKNARRRWCSMATCGNRAKAARHYARHRAGES